MSQANAGILHILVHDNNCFAVFSLNKLPLKMHHLEPRRFYDNRDLQIGGRVRHSVQARLFKPGTFALDCHISHQSCTSSLLFNWSATGRSEGSENITGRFTSCFHLPQIATQRLRSQCLLGVVVPISISLGIWMWGAPRFDVRKVCG